ncbi:MAG: hypothetical protein GXP63_04610 [DPANN group archaeon]|nr:hypothetical protein [DPANN group archaeon]
MEPTKGQVSAEFIGVLTIMFLILTVFSVVILNKTLELQDEKNWNRLTQLGGLIASEIQLADTMHDGFSRRFWIPYNIEGYTFGTVIYPADATRNKSTIQIFYTNALNQTVPYSLNLPREVKGNVTPGFNNLTKRENTICINTVSCP